MNYRTVIEFENKSKDELYVAIRQNLATMLNNSNYAIQYQDKEEGTFIVKCHDDVKWNFMVCPTDYNMTINIKDGRIRVTFDNVEFTVKVGLASSKGHIENESSLNDFKKYANTIIARLKSGVNKMTTEDDDW